MDVGRYIRSGWWGTFAFCWDDEVLIMQYHVPRSTRGVYLIFPAEAPR